MTYDAVVVHGFGGPEQSDDVMPFLERVTSGRGVPRERLEKVAEHYYALGGRSPINDHGRALVQALGPALAARGLSLPVHFGTRFASPYFTDVVADLVARGAKRLLAIPTSAHSGQSSCRAYVDAQRAVSGATVDKVRQYWNHPGVIAAQLSRFDDALAALPEPRRARARLLATAHSVPTSFAATSTYEVELREVLRIVREGRGVADAELVFQSRSGPPAVPWLEPDVLDAIRRARDEGVEDVVLLPIGFTSDHVEVIWDLDREARDLAESLGLGFVRAATVGTHPDFVAALADLVFERTTGRSERPVVGNLAAAPDTCLATCCPMPAPGRPARP